MCVVGDRILLALILFCVEEHGVVVVVVVERNGEISECGTARNKVRFTFDTYWFGRPHGGPESTAFPDNSLRKFIL
jgi:hypothetical protein